MRYQPIYDIAELCFQKGITQAILCPGSRSAPLTLAFAQHPGITARTMSDERSAAFIAMGMAQQKKNPVALVCTSGSAAYHFSPAVAEAFFQQIPLLLFTADRPKEWIDQFDGQTIRQENIYGTHVKKSFTLPQDYEHPDSVWFIERIINEAVNLSEEFPKGPVHINAPFREPLYPTPKEKIIFSKRLKIIQPVLASHELQTQEIEKLKDRLASFSKILIVAGQTDFDATLIEAVDKFSRAHGAPIVGDILSNLHSNKNVIRYADSFLPLCSREVQRLLQPELLITFGKSIISKNTKLFLRNQKPIEHWHIQPAGAAADTFQSLTKIIHADLIIFFNQLSFIKKTNRSSLQQKKNYFQHWQQEEQRMSTSTAAYFNKESANEIAVMNQFMAQLPSRCNVHLANSMSVRYANYIGIRASKKDIRVFSNRGTSGIDGCTSVAVGHSLCDDAPNFLITGDVAFFYDRNAFWHNYPLPNLRILLLNNHGGIIFNLMDGASDATKRDEFFVTRQPLTARHLCNEFGFDYCPINSSKKNNTFISDFFTFDGKTKIAELENSQEESKKSFIHFKQQIKFGYGT